ncbi:MAG: hypothetical protein WA902_01240 [Thermosynechococcaceae cyanobacterium]
MAGFELSSEVTTKSTDFDGSRHPAWSEWSSAAAPDNHVINHNEVKVEWISDNGSENTYQMIFSDWVELIAGSGLKAPRTIKVQTYARSPKGSLAGRGWTKIKFTGKFVKYK